VCNTVQGNTLAKETILHFLFNCPAYQNEYHNLNTALGHCSRDLKFIPSSTKHTCKLLKFISHTKRLKEPFRDLPSAIAQDA
jgi:hypothetical protein